MNNEQLNNIFTDIAAFKLGPAITKLENYLLTYPQSADMERLNALKDSFRLLTIYWQRGYADPEREQMYTRLLQQVYNLTTNIATRYQQSVSPFLKAIHQRPRTPDKSWSVQTIRSKMENFVSEVALLELEPEGTRKELSRLLYQSHMEEMRDLFEYILTSHQWKDTIANTFIQLLLSPTLASIDQQLIASAIMMSCQQNFCFQKFRILTEVYRQSTDEPLRQRALVGWVINADSSKAAVFPEMKEIVRGLCESAECRNELTELQMQLLFTVNAEEYTNKIQHEILPDIISNSNVKVTQKGLIEMDEDKLEDILHPEQAERNMERMEQSMKRMAEMHKQGADIYFGGFSQMKRFTFFTEISNWFVPFYKQHPAISAIWNNTKGKKFLQLITSVGAFCDSDKYSFVLAFNQVLDRLPKSVVQMVEQGEAIPVPLGGETDLEEQAKPAFVRRMYLQDIYRFYKLFPSRSEFRNPFLNTDAGSAMVFFSGELFKDTALESDFISVVGFLMKRGLYAEALSVMKNMSDSKHDLNYFLMMGSILQHLPSCEELSPLLFFKEALALDPDNERALTGYARSLFTKQDYAESLQAYKKLMLLAPDHVSYQLNAAICHINLNQCEEALKILYKLDYMHPDEPKTKRVLAWTLTLAGKYEQADKLYIQLLAAEEPAPSDWLNCGYCQWMAGQVTKALDMFRHFIAAQQPDEVNMEREFMTNEYQLLTSHNISDVEIMLMLNELG